jgi:uncharacterized membrane protein
MPDDAPLQVIVAAFADTEGASTALKELRQAPKDQLQVKEAAVLVRDPQGKLDIRESHHVTRGAVLGGLAGAVVGLIAGPVGWVTVGGAAVGALAARLRDSGFPDKRLREIAESLKPGTSALIVIVEQRWIVEVENRLRPVAADLAVQELKQEVAVQLDEEAKTKA